MLARAQVTPPFGNGEGIVAATKDQLTTGFKLESGDDFLYYQRFHIAVPLNDVAIEVIREQIGKNLAFVFTYKGKNVSGCNNHAWRKALVRAGIENFRWHDLRHTWASWHIQNGTPLHILQELGGWSSYEMVRRYAHLSSEHLSEYANNSKTVTNLLQYENKEESKNA